MSKVHKEKIECIHCKVKGMFDIWDSMNVNLDPELREKVFNDEVFLYTCPKCDHQTVVPYGTLYHDVKHRFLLFFDFFKPDDFNYKPIDVSNEPRVKNYTFRHVTGIWRLKEKIVILEKGLNDVAIERMKYMIKHELHPEMAEKSFEIYFGEIHLSDKDVSEQGFISFLYFDENDEAFSLQYPLESYVEQCEACEADPRMQVKGCENIDEGWIAMKLQGEEA